MFQTGILKERKGFLCVMMDITATYSPEVSHCYYPITEWRDTFTEWLDKTVVNERGGGRYKPSNWNGPEFQLMNAGQTTPIDTETVPIPLPFKLTPSLRACPDANAPYIWEKWNKKEERWEQVYRWNYGHYEKHTKTYGWEKIT